MNKNQQIILEFAKKNNISGMSYREIARKLGFKHPQTVIHHLGQLRKKELIYFDKDKRQRIAEPKAFAVDNFLRIPIVGSANCGPAQELAQEYVQGYLPISKKLVSNISPDKLIAIKAVGDSLNKANIRGDEVEDGDYLVVDCSNTDPSDGDYVLSIIDGLANFKKFYKDDIKKEIRLVSESTLNIPPITLHEDDMNTSGYLVNGVVIRVVKN
jgi:SOS-response transcriptional repressor LexA